MAETMIDWQIVEYEFAATSILCERCTREVPRRSPQHKYCDDCRPLAQASYAAEWTKRNRRKLDRSVTERCNCGALFQPYTAAKGGPHVRCPACQKTHKLRLKQAWRESTAGKASLARQQRRRKGEFVADQRMGPRT